MNSSLIKTSVACLALLASAAGLQAGTIIKTNNADNLNLTTSWVGGVVPGPVDIAKWDATVTGANSVALGADTAWSGINVSNPAGPVTITAGNTLTLSTNGIDMSKATQNLTIGADLTLRPGQQVWNVTNGLNLTVGGALTRSGGATLVVGSQIVAATNLGTVTASPPLENGIVPWVSVRTTGAATNGLFTGSSFATVSSGTLVAYTNATLENTAGTGVSFGGIPTGDNSTVNYDLGVASTGGVMVADTYVNSLRNVGGAYLQAGTANFRANAIMNAGTNILSINTPVQQADTSLNEIVLSAWTAGITFNSNVISDNLNPLRLVVSGTNNQAVLIFGQNTFSGGVTLNSGRVTIGANSIPTSGTVTSGPLGTGTVTFNGGTLFAASGGFSIGNPIVVGPGGGQLQGSGASPDLSINGNVTGSGVLIMAGVFNQNGLFLNGDNTAFNGTVLVSGSNNRLGTEKSGSTLAKFIVNSALQAQLLGGGTYKLGELSGASTGGLVGHAVNTTPSFQIWEVGALNTSSTYAGIFQDNASGNAQTGNSDGAANNLVGLTKVGTGTLTLAGNSTASGPVTISAGTLQLGTNGTTGKLGVNATIVNNATLVINRTNAVVQGTDFSGNAITGSGTLTQAGSGTTTLTAANTYAGDTLVSAGTLLVNGSLSSTATVQSGAKLGGSGSINGVVTVQSGGTLQAGPTATNIGTLTLYSTPVLGGSVLVKINAGTAQADQIVVLGNPINYGGSLVVSNLGVPLLAGDTFTIVSAPVHNGSFSSIVGNPGPGLAYSFANGVLSVISTGAAYATNSTPTSVTASSASDLSGNPLLSVGWPSDHVGWVLQSQTDNSGVGVQWDPAPWIDVLGSAVLSATNLPVDRTIPGTYYRLRYIAPPQSAVPTIQTARGTNHAVVLSWTAAANARSYNLKNATVSGGPYTPVANLIGTSYTNTPLVNGTTYYFVVSAVNYFGESANSVETNATPIAIPPAVPTNLTVQAAHSLVQLNWNAVNGAAGYNVKRGTTSGGPYDTTVITTSPVYSDTTVVDGTTYYYVVSSFNIDAESANSAEVTASPQAVPPAAPTGLTARGQYSQVRLVWTASFGATSYNVKRATVSGGPYTTITNTTSTVIYDTDVVNDTTYYYVVTALNDLGESANSLEASATPTSVLPLYYDFENTGSGFSVTLPPPNLRTNFPYITPLPNPFNYASDPLNIGGTGSTNFSDWEHHRAEILAMIQTYEIGPKPVVDPSMISASISGTGTTRTLTVIVTNVVSGTNRTLTLSSAISLPNTGAGPFPVCIGMNGPNGSVNSALLTTNNIARLTFTINQVTTYGGKAATDPFYRLYAAPYTPSIDTVYTGQYAAWSWGCSRLIDGLVKLNGNLGGGATIDLTHIMVTGCSYAGKMALFCGAFDERVALTIAQESGGGGANSWRYNELVEAPGSVEDIDNTDYGWFGNQMKNFSGTNVVFLPEDHHMLCSLVAPRALFATGNDGQVWLGTPSTYVTCRATEKVYNTLGVGDRFGFNIIGNHPHCGTTTNVDNEMSVFIQKFMLSSNTVNTLVRDYPTPSNPIPGFNFQVGVMVDDYDKIPYANWTSWWGTTNPVVGGAMGPSCGTGQAQQPCP